jgi:hypothetical protein
METNEKFDLEDRMTILRMKALRITLADNMNCYLLAFN